MNGLILKRISSKATAVERHAENYEGWRQGEIYALVTEMERELADPEQALGPGQLDGWKVKGVELGIDIFHELARHLETKRNQIKQEESELLF